MCPLVVDVLPDAVASELALTSLSLKTVDDVMIGCCHANAPSKHDVSACVSACVHFSAITKF